MDRKDEYYDQYLRGIKVGERRGRDLWYPRVIGWSVVAFILGVMLGILGYVQFLSSLQT